jgi:hypothetical protein
MQTSVISNTKTIPSQKMTNIITQNESRELSNNALYIINSHYKDNSILIQYANENRSCYEDENERNCNEGPTIETRTLHVILHSGYTMNKENGLCIPVFQYDTIHFQYIIGNDSIPDYCIDQKETTYHNVINKNNFIRT